MTDVVTALPALEERARRLVQRNPRRALLGVVGPPGSGKSTLVGRLVAALAPDAVAVPMDGFHLAGAELVRLDRQHRKGAPDTFDAEGYVALLRRLRGQDHAVVYAPAFDRALEEPVAGAVPVPPEVPLVITEGNYLLLRDEPWDQVRGLLDETWFVEADPSLRVERLIARHVRYGKAPDAAREWVLRSDESNAALVEATRGHADLLVSLS